MKKQPVSLFFAAFLIAVAAFLTPSCWPFNPKPCKLPAPQNLAVTVTSPTTAVVEWSPVTGANGYLLTVTDSLSGALFGTFNTPETKQALIGLTPGNIYTANVRAVCPNGIPSPDSDSANWQQGSIIIADVVVMTPGPGLDDCDCDTEATWPNQPRNSDATIDLPTHDYSLNERAVYLIRVNKGGSVFYMKLAFDKDCWFISVNYEGCERLQMDIALTPATDSEAIEFSVPGEVTPFLTLKPYQAGLDASFTLVFASSCTDCTFDYLLCPGAERDCPE